MKRLFCLLFLLPVFCFTEAQVSTRLNSGWEFLRQDLGGIWEAVRPVAKGSPESVPLWINVGLPHCSSEGNEVDPDNNYYQGPAWYRTQLAISNPYAKGRTLLHFEGAGQKTEVYVYTTKVGAHVGGYDEFTVDITDAVKEFSSTEICRKQFGGKIPVSIRTDNSRDLEMIPSSMSDFMVYGGIYRYLNLVYVPEVSIERIFAKPVLDAKLNKATVQLQGRLYAPGISGNAKVEVVLRSPEGKILQQQSLEAPVKEGSVALTDFTVSKPVLWSTDAPTLYEVEVSVHYNGAQHKLKEKIGFRKAEFVPEGPFLLNGKRLLLRGTHRHEDGAGVGAALTESMIRQEMLLMKAMGVNFIRLGHYQQSRIVLDLCDSLGILVWEEIPWCRGGLGGEVYQTQAKHMLTNMVEQHFNHPAIIIWGMGNENDWPGDFPEFSESKIRAFMKELHDLSHQLDPSRLTAIRRCDFCKDIVDVYSPSIWAGWYRGIYTEYKATSEKEFNRVNKFLHVEWGGDSHQGRHAENPDNALQQIKTGQGNDERTGDASLYGGGARVSKDGDWSESYIANLFEWHLKEQETMPWLTGTAQWVFKDFATPLRPENPVPYVNQKGVLGRDMSKKESYYIFQSYWTEKPMAHIYGHSWPVRWGKEGELKMLKVYSNCDAAELFLNGKSLGKKKRNSSDFPAAGLRWSAQFKPGKNEVKVVAVKGIETVTDSISFIYQTETWGKPAQLQLTKIAETEDSATVEVKLLDAKGTLCLDAADYIRFSLAGNGKLADNLGTAAGARLVQAYNGRAVISIQKNKGKNVVAAHNTQLGTVFLSL